MSNIHSRTDQLCAEARKKQRNRQNELLWDSYEDYDLSDNFNIYFDSIDVDIFNFYFFSPSAKRCDVCSWRSLEYMPGRLTGFSIISGCPTRRRERAQPWRMSIFFTRRFRSLFLRCVALEQRRILSSWWRDALNSQWSTDDMIGLLMRLYIYNLNKRREKRDWKQAKPSRAQPCNLWFKWNWKIIMLVQY